MDKGCFPRSLPKTRTRSLIQLMPKGDLAPLTKRAMPPHSKKAIALLKQLISF
ncbi:hypothetical protein [Nostoc sp. ChiQUE01b]|uniref:hypothetical protein n=1 Tax=Nostoc sp. ChiQUE01b TaxID=3075376 RepID=UPI002AD582E7|nr:hypothetical protein [Nostoc sp. ChiQUE01b]